MSWLGASGEALERALGLPRVLAVQSVGSTMDEAHQLAAAGAPSGSLVIAEEQTAGRGRGGKSWTSVPGAGIWTTIIERPRDAAAIDVLSLRVGLRLAPVLERWTTAPVRLKWPNDLFVGPHKLAGVLIEARWRGGRVDWVAIGIGVNLRATFAEAAALEGADPQVVLAEVIPAVRAAAFASGALTDSELAEFTSRDLASGRLVSHPAEGTARGISRTGELLVETTSGITPCRAGSLVLVH